MPIFLASNIAPRNAFSPDPELRGTYYMVEDVYFKGGFQIRADALERDSINPLNLKHGMWVKTLNDGKVWELGEDLSSWTEVQFGSGGGTNVRKFINTVQTVPANGQTNFTLALAKTSTILRLYVDKPITVQAFSTQARNDSNPYTFVATADHLEDDGSSKMTDGSIFYGRRYSTFSNLEPVPTDNIYFTMTKTTDVEVDVTLNIVYLPTE